jgi:hypothetical protein
MTKKFGCGFHIFHLSIFRRLILIVHGGGGACSVSSDFERRTFLDVFHQNRARSVGHYHFFHLALVTNTVLWTNTHEPYSSFLMWDLWCIGPSPAVEHNIQFLSLEIN